MKLSHQIAQKLHGLTEDGSQRAHDLVDLQIIIAQDAVDFSEVKDVCLRLFAYRNQQPWPPKLIASEEWADLYKNAAAGMNLIQDLDDAISWCTNLIAEINAAGEHS